MKYTILMCFLSFFACKKQNYPKKQADGFYHYGYCSTVTGKPGKVISNKTIGFADTTIVSVSGNVSFENEGTFGASILFFDKKENQTQTAQADIDGNYQLNLKAGAYKISYLFTGYEPVLMENIDFIGGQIQKINVELGGSTYYESCVFKTKKKLTPKQFHKKIDKMGDK